MSQLFVLLPNIKQFYNLSKQKDNRWIPVIKKMNPCIHERENIYVKAKTMNSRVREDEMVNTKSKDCYKNWCIQKNSSMILER